MKNIGKGIETATYRRNFPFPLLFVKRKREDCVELLLSLINLNFE